MLSAAKTFLIIACVATSCVCLVSQQRSAYAVKDSHPVPGRWRRVGPAPGEHMLNLQIGLRQSRFDDLERHLYEGICTILLLRVSQRAVLNPLK